MQQQQELAPFKRQLLPRLCWARKACLHAQSGRPTPAPPLLPLPAGWLYDQTSSWALALFAPSVFFFLTGSGEQGLGRQLLRLHAIHGS